MEKHKQDKRRSQQAIETVIDALNKQHSELLHTKCYFEDDRLHVHGYFWRSVVSIAKELNLGAMIVGEEHVYLF